MALALVEVALSIAGWVECHIVSPADFFNDTFSGSFLLGLVCFATHKRLYRVTIGNVFRQDRHTGCACSVGVSISLTACPPLPTCSAA